MIFFVGLKKITLFFNYFLQYFNSKCFRIQISIIFDTFDISLIFEHKIKKFFICEN